MCDFFACIEWIQQRPFIVIAFFRFGVYWKTGSHTELIQLKASLRLLGVVNLLEVTAHCSW